METIKNLQQVLIFEQVAKHGSYTKASIELGVSKAYVSKTVQKLEDELGQKLINRSTRVVKLTEAGKQFYSVCSQSIGNISEAQKLIMQKSPMPKGKIRISLAGAFGEDYITPYIAKFINKYPEVKFELFFEEKIVDLLRGSYDIGIRVGKLDDSSLVAKQIAQRKYYICGTPQYFKKNKIPLHPKDLNQLNCLSSTGSWKLILNGQEKQLKLNSNFKSNNGRSLLKSTLLGLGVSMLPGVYVKEHIEKGELVSILESFTPKEATIWAITPHTKNMPHSVRLFLDGLDNEFREEY